MGWKDKKHRRRNHRRVRGGFRGPGRIGQAAENWPNFKRSVESGGGIERIAREHRLILCVADTSLITERKGRGLQYGAGSGDCRIQNTYCAQ